MGWIDNKYMEEIMIKYYKLIKHKIELNYSIEMRLVNKWLLIKLIDICVDFFMVQVLDKIKLKREWKINFNSKD